MQQNTNEPQSPLQHLSNALEVSLSLRSLLLRRTPIGDLGALALGAALSSSALVELDLGECALTDQGLRALVRGVTSG